MSALLELVKLKRTGFAAAIAGCALLSSAVPVVNMAVRAENYVSLPGNAFQIMADANWQMMALFNILMVVLGACIIYHTEFADNGIQKMRVLPVSEGVMYLSKFALIAFSLAVMVILETASLALCAAHWFPAYEPDLGTLALSAVFQFVVVLPTAALMLLIASACKNMWISLGTGVILVFTLMIMPQDNAVLSLLPFSAPYQLLSAALANGRAWLFTGVCTAQTIVFAACEFAYLKIRRGME